MATNVVAGVAPSLYVRLTRQTGRGDPSRETPDDVANYFLECFDDYLARLGATRESAELLLKDRTIVEYGPGDLPGTAALFVAHGARRVHCVDRFAMVRLNDKNLQVFDALAAKLPGPQAARLRGVLARQPGGTPTLDPERINYIVNRHGLCGLVSEADFAVSRAVLELVESLGATFADMTAALRPGGVALHQVDLRNHGFHRRAPLDFLNWPTWQWTLMHSNKGVPNRWRLDRYRDIVAGLGVTEVSFDVFMRIAGEDVERVRPQFAEPFRGLPAEDLGAMAFWLRFRKPNA